MCIGKVIKEVPAELFLAASAASRSKTVCPWSGFPSLRFNRPAYHHSGELHSYILHYVAAQRAGRAHLLIHLLLQFRKYLMYRMCNPDSIQCSEVDCLMLKGIAKIIIMPPALEPWRMSSRAML